MASLEETVKQLLREETRRSGAASSSAEAAHAQQARERRLAVQAAARTFKLDELGTGSATGGNQQHQKHRFTLIERVFALGGPKPPEMQAEWKMWLQRLDKCGCMHFRWSWRTRLRNEMVDVLQDLQNGQSNAALRWHRRKTLEWRLNSGALTVPGQLSSSAGSGAHGG